MDLQHHLAAAMAGCPECLASPGLIDKVTEIVSGLRVRGVSVLGVLRVLSDVIRLAAGDGSIEAVIADVLALIGGK